MRVFACQKIVIFIIRMPALLLSHVLFLLCLTCSIFITSWILKFCMLIFVTIVFWSDWLTAFLITCLIMIVKQILITWVFDLKAVAQSVFFIMWIFVSAEFNMSTISSLRSFLVIIIFFLLLFSIFVFTVFMIFADLISSSSRNEHLYYKIMISHLICLSIILIIKFIFIFSIST